MHPKSHHTIPRLHLQHFAGKQPAGQVWAYDSATGKSWSAIPEESAVQTHFYSAERNDGTMDTRIEAFLAEVEGRAAPIYERLLNGWIPEESQERADFAQFLALMYTRTTAMRRMAAQFRGQRVQVRQHAYATDPVAFERLVKGLEAERGEQIDQAIKEEIRQEMLHPSGAYVIEVSQESTLMALSASDRLAPLLYRMKWTLVEVLQDYLITSDNPLVRWVNPKTRSPICGDGGFLNKTTEVTFPLSPKSLLLMSWQGEVPDRGTFDQEHVDFANESRAAHSERYLYAHVKDERISRLAAKYRNSRPGITMERSGPQTFAPVEVGRRSKRK